MADRKNANGLNQREQVFADTWLKDPNGSAAAKKAGYGGDEKTLRVTASRLLIRDNVALYIKKKLAKVAEKNDLTVEMIVGQLRAMAFFDVRKLYNEDGSMKAVHELDDETARVITDVEIEEIKGKDKAAVVRILKAKFESRKGPLDTLAKYMKMFSDAPVLNVSLEAKKVVFS